jgi:hypothetical protein
VLSPSSSDLLFNSAITALPRVNGILEFRKLFQAGSGASKPSRGVQIDRSINFIFGI